MATSHANKQVKTSVFTIIASAAAQLTFVNILNLSKFLSVKKLISCYKYRRLWLPIHDSIVGIEHYIKILMTRSLSRNEIKASMKPVKSFKHWVPEESRVMHVGGYMHCAICSYCASYLPSCDILSAHRQWAGDVRLCVTVT